MVRGALPYINHIHMRRPGQRVWFLRSSGLRTGIDRSRWYRLCPFWFGIGYGFRGNYVSV